ncbi:MAG: dUTP diphosphatase [Fusobacteriaceae bacterium]|jgi:dUTP pyrophosphatase|nr:dUTP diphosphatase [Fusobacteriaceae bacterium]
MEKVKVKIIKEAGVDLPKYMTEESAGMDIKAFIKEPIILGSLERVLVPTGIKLEILKGYEVQVRPRSGLAIKHGITLLNTPGTIDSDYRGEIKIIVVNLSKDNYTIENGERLAQLVLQKVYKMDLEEVSELNITQRNDGGFGHTGK